VQINKTHAHLLTLAAEIVSAHVAHNDTSAELLPDLIKDIYGTLANLGAAVSVPDREIVAPHRQVPRAVAHAGHRHDHDHDHRHVHNDRAPSDDYLVCLEDGLTMKMLKRHLQTVHGLTPDEYREKWGLPDDYPMVAANYAKLRSSLAKESGLGLRPDARPKRYRR